MCLLDCVCYNPADRVVLEARLLTVVTLISGQPTSLTWPCLFFHSYHAAMLHGRNTAQEFRSSCIAKSYRFSYTGICGQRRVQLDSKASLHASQQHQQAAPSVRTSLTFNLSPKSAWSCKYTAYINMGYYVSKTPIPIAGTGFS
jgi:hypothetical protein